MNRKKQEQIVVEKMIHIYCRHKEGNKELCKNCIELLEYAQKRIKACPMSDHKKSCRVCPIHCYQTKMKAKMQKVMRYSGPRMLLYHPIDALIHLWYEMR